MKKLSTHDNHGQFAAAILIITTAAIITLTATAAPHPAATSPQSVINKMQQKFLSYKLKSYTYDEIRVATYEVTDKSRQTGISPVAETNGSTTKARYFYQSPSKHGYRLLSERMDNYWIGSPNQLGALPMDSKWKNKVISWYSLKLLPDTTVDKNKCYSLALTPKPGKPAAYGMTWYIDKKYLVIRKFIYDVNYGDYPLKVTGTMKFKTLKNGLLFPTSATWTTKVHGLPFIFKTKSIYTNYHFNIPLDPSVFKEEYPPDWLNKMKEQQIQSKQKGAAPSFPLPPGVSPDILK